MKVHFLGTSSASVTADRDNTSILAEAGSNLVLFDCGGNPAGKILHLGYEPLDLDAIFLTHLHIDHCYGLPTLLFHMFLAKRSRPLKLFCPEEEFDIMNQQLLSHGIENDVRTYSIEKVAVPADPTRLLWETDHAAVCAGESEHSRACRAYRLQEIRTGRKIVLTGDTTPLDDMVTLTENVDLLIHESTYLDSHEKLASDYGHSTARQAGMIAARSKAKALALVHFEIPPGCTVNNYRSEAADVYKGTIYTPDDMTSLTI